MITGSIEVYRTLLKFILHLTKKFQEDSQTPPKNAVGVKLSSLIHQIPNIKNGDCPLLC